MSDHPFTTPEGSEARMFIQWKGTKVCMDFTCGSCGLDGHLDEGFTYFVQCERCGTTYELGTQVIAKRVDPDRATEGATVVIDQWGHRGFHK